MVRILSSGEIVPDTDPRANQTSQPQSGETRSRQGYIRHDDNMHQQQMGGGGSFIDNVNARLTRAGVPTWHAGPYPVEPIVSLGLLLSFLFGGLRGVLFAGVLFFVVKYSQGGGSSQGQRGVQGRGGGHGDTRSGGSRSGVGSWSGGNRLGN